jgi:cytochrome c556
MVNAAHTPENRERIIRTQQTTGAPLTLRQQLNSEYMAQMMKARAVAKSRNPKDVVIRKRAEAYMAELAEQLTLLDAIEFGFIVPLVPEWAS